ncbi:MAG: sulfite exporter TauE/SafE family protein [Candidatus Saccharimonas sp.]|nr:sulfite exporter TauE/SafE family protein [Candidatus Saccharimonas sp.]
MTLLFISFFAGALTVLAPCILPMLPIIIGGSLVGHHSIAWRRTLTIIAGLSLSVLIFSLLLKGTTLLIGVPDSVWRIMSGGIVIALGINFLFPQLWLNLAAKFMLQQNSDKALSLASAKSGSWGALLTGAALGPVFSSCSPTYGLIIAAILPVNATLGIVYLACYVLGMSIALLLIAYFGRAITQKLRWSVEENGWFRKTLGIVFIVVGLAVATGSDRVVQSWLLERGVYNGATGLESLVR